MFDYLDQRKKILNQYKELSKKLPNKFINFKKADQNSHSIISNIFNQNKTENIISNLDPETKSFILSNLNNTSSIFHKYTNSYFNCKKKKFIKNKFFNQQTIILTKYNDNKMNIDKKIRDKNDNVINYKTDKCKYNNSYSANIFPKKDINKDNNNFEERLLKRNKRKNLIQSFYNEINNFQNKKNLEIIVNDKNNNNKINYKKEEKNSQKCQTSFASTKPVKDIDSKNNHSNSLTLRNVEELINLNNIKKVSEKKNNIKYKTILINNEIKEIKEINLKNKFYNTYYSTNNQKSKLNNENDKFIKNIKHLNDNQKNVNKNEEDHILDYLKIMQFVVI